MQRDILIRVTYKIDTDNGLEITPANKVEDMVYNDMLEYFCQDEGFSCLEVEVKDNE